MVRNKIEIYPIFKSLSWWRKFRYKKIVQNSDFKYGVKIVNRRKPYFFGTIKNVFIFPLNKNFNFEVVSDKIYPINNLLENEMQIIWFDKTNSPFSGPFGLGFELETEENIINFNNIHFKIIDENSLHQKITNILLVILTILLSTTSIYSLIF